ncbi:MAG TPA: RcnB family protein [Steroidobacteraceae bacterium]|nr:RcnB family protein [Steroidobacteraceae bacterium]
MSTLSRPVLSLTLALFLVGPFAASAQQPEREHGTMARPPAHGEAYPGPSRYHRVAPPKGWNSRPQAPNRQVYQHNYQAPRSYRIGPYHRPPGWEAHHWVYGQILPRVYWAPEYYIGDYWLFGLQVPPAGYEWVRDDDDALLVNITTGEILQVQYGVFA